MSYESPISVILDEISSRIKEDEKSTSAIKSVYGNRDSEHLKI